MNQKIDKEYRVSARKLCDAILALLLISVKSAIKAELQLRNCEGLCIFESAQPEQLSDEVADIYQVQHQYTKQVGDEGADFTMCLLAKHKLAELLMKHKLGTTFEVSLFNGTNAESELLTLENLEDLKIGGFHVNFEPKSFPLPKLEEALAEMQKFYSLHSLR